MPGHFIEFTLPEIVSTLETIDIIVITIGSLKTFYHYIKALLTHKHYPIHTELVNALALGLEFKMSAEILKMVFTRSFSEIYILGVIVLLRALLSLMIHFEIKTEKKHGSVSEASSNNYQHATQYQLGIVLLLFIPVKSFNMGKAEQLFEVGFITDLIRRRVNCSAYIPRSTRGLQDSDVGCNFYMEVYPSFKLFIGIDSTGL